MRVGKQKAFLRDGEWRSADRALEDRLNALTQDWVEESGGPALDSQDPELDAAKVVAKRAHGRIQLHTPTDPRVAARTWFARRQYKLAFQ